MPETLVEIMAAEQAATSAPESSTEATPSIQEPIEPASQPEPAPETPVIDDFIKRASEKTGMNLEDLKDEDGLFQSYAAARRKLSERDELHKLGETIINSPYAAKIWEVLQGKAEESKPTQTPEPSSKAPSEPEWDASWESLVQSENPPPDVLAKYNRRRAWERQRAEALIRSETLQQLATDPEAYVRKLVEPLLNPLRETQEQVTRRQAEEKAQEAVKAVLAPVEKQIFSGEWGDWNTVTQFGEKIKQRYLSRPALVQSSPIDWMQECVAVEQSLVPQPKPTLPVPNAAQRAPNAGAPPIDPNAIEKAVDAAIAANPNMSLYEIEKLYKKFSGQEA